MNHTYGPLRVKRVSECTISRAQNGEQRQTRGGNDKESTLIKVRKVTEESTVGGVQKGVRPRLPGAGVGWSVRNLTTLHLTLGDSALQSYKSSSQAADCQYDLLTVSAKCCIQTAGSRSRGGTRRKAARMENHDKHGIFA